MALKLTVVTPQGFEAVDAYHRAECPQVGLDKVASAAFLRAYRTGAEGESCFSEQLIAFAYSEDAGSIFRQAYIAAKSLPAFEKAEDC